MDCEVLTLPCRHEWTEPTFPTLPLAPGGLFWVGLALVGAGLAGELSRRWLRCPRIVGYAAAGLCAGMLGRGIVDENMINQTRILIDMALALALFELGHRLSLTWLRAIPGCC